MTKAEIVEHIYEKVGFSKKESAELVEKVFEIIKETLANGEKVKISGFGNFVVNEKRPRKGRNPQTGEEIVITGRRVLTFKASQVLKKTMGDGTPGSVPPPASTTTSRTGRTRPASPPRTPNWPAGWTRWPADAGSPTTCGCSPWRPRPSPGPAARRTCATSNRRTWWH